MDGVRCGVCVCVEAHLPPTPRHMSSLFDTIPSPDRSSDFNLFCNGAGALETPSSICRLIRWNLAEEPLSFGLLARYLTAEPPSRTGSSQILASLFVVRKACMMREGEKEIKRKPATKHCLQ